MGEFVLDFERPIVELEKRIKEMKNYALEEDIELAEEVHKLESRLEKLIQETYSKLTRWQRVQLARHPDRPYTLDYIGKIFTDFIEIHGDRLFRDDPALVKTVMDLGKKANGKHAELKIVEIPDDVDWEITEYDGLEQVEEKHRIWT